MGLAGMSLSRELRALALSHTAPETRPACAGPQAQPENSVTKSRADSAFTQQVVGCVEAINP